MSETPIVYLNGEFVSADRARITVFDGGWLHGAGLFETIRAEHGRLFRVETHLQRLCRSAESLVRPLDRARLPDRVDFLDLLARNGLSHARVRLTVTAGNMLEGAEGSALTVCATASPLDDPSGLRGIKGVGVAISPHRVSPSDPLAGHKTTSYLPRLLALRAAHQKRCSEAIWFTTENRLAEGSISNVFVVSGGSLRTPPLNTPVLPGVTRELVLLLAGREGVPVEERAMTINDLLDADEVFLTNTITQVVPVLRVESRDIGSGKVGPLTLRLSEACRALVSEECQRE